VKGACSDISDQNLIARARYEWRSFAAETYQRLRDELTERYGGVTAFTSVPAEGEIRASTGKVLDDIVVTKS
jgi:hypothetical protein